MVNAPLDRLCTLCGIGLDYVDIWGHAHAVGEATKQALLAAMGIAAGNDAEIEQALAKQENQSWLRRLPPVQVVRWQEVPFAIPLTLAADPSQEFSWALTLESGERHEGRIRLDQLQPLEQRQIGERQYARYRFLLPLIPGPGYHRFELCGDAGAAAMSLIVAPDTCYCPQAMQEDGRVWGVAAQLYGLRSQRNWGIGDFSDLKGVVEFCAEQGGGVVGVSPIHALFPHDPARAGPYGPSSRLYFNVLYLDVEAIPEFAECEVVARSVRAQRFQAQLRALRAEELVQYQAVAAAKFSVLERLYAHFRAQHLRHETDLGRAFRAFQQEQGAPLQRLALFEALQAHFHAQDASVWGWQAWPEPYRNPEAPEVAQFLEEHHERVEFYAYLQWQAQRQLAAIGQRAWELRLGVGLMLDLTVSISRGGAEEWAAQALYANGAGIGAPPDDFNLYGQDWGLLPPIPQRLVEAAYAPYIATLRASMRYAGALRIDHVMGLQRLFWVPTGGSPADGAYIQYPFSDLLGILALESQRNQCLILGEDLGTVPDAVRAALQPLGVLSYRLLYFERNGEGAFRPPAEYPAQALVAAATHDLPTLAGFWQGRDLELRHSLGLFPAEAQRDAQIIDRAQDRARLLVALDKENLLPTGAVPNPVLVPQLAPEYMQAIHAYLARSPSKLMLVQLEDMFGQTEQVNLPGTTEAQYPNWRRKLPLNLEEWRDDPPLRSLTETLRRERGSSVLPAPATDEVVSPPLRRIPRATYRLQFNAQFTFAHASALVDYLCQLGISHCYASPLLKARPGSQHGYDMIDHNALNPELGSEEEFERFVAALHAHGMGQILDIVPNHMGIMGADNAWWLDVLENGPASAYAQFFDIDWFPYSEELQCRLLLPILGDHYGTVLENGELQLAFDAPHGEFSVFYYMHRLPLDPGEYTRILGHGLDKLAARLGPEQAQVLEFHSLVTAFGHLPGRRDTAPEKIAERARDKEILKQHLAAMYRASADIARFIDDNLAEFNAGGSDLARFQLLHELLAAQCYRLAYWRVATDEINYRRFFDINDLAALRMENLAVFEATHRRVLDWLATGKVDGLRIDHADGLYDPVQYFQRLRQYATSPTLPGTQGGAGEGADAPRPPYLVVEKILAAHERLPAHWPVAGTTGYDFMNQCNALLIDPAAASRLEQAYAEFIGETIDFDELCYASKRLIMKVALAGELNVLALQLSRIAAADRYTCDFTLNSLRSALAEVVAWFPVYRTYVSAEQVSADDMRHVDWAIAVAKKRSQAADLGVFDFIRDVLLKVRAEGKSQAFQEVVANFAMKFQQYTAPVMAKGMEDTAFYLYHRLASLNEVGGDPRRFGMQVSAFHKATLERARHFPHAMLATSTHDSKRSEDVRARISVLSELADEWREAVARWSHINQLSKRVVDNQPAPSRNDEYLLYQTLLGVWPLEQLNDTACVALGERVVNYMLKAVREAKARSSWINPATEYEAAVSGFVRALLAHGSENRFLTMFLPFQQRIARLGLFNSLSQLLIKLTAPGVPDIYQGNELWDFSLVDPDNRRPVDYPRRQAMLAELQALFATDSATVPGLARQLLDTLQDGRIKLYLTWRTLAFRQRNAGLFQNGSYLPLKACGPQSEHLCAYARQNAGEVVLLMLPRLFAALMPDESDLPLGPAVWQDTGIVLPAALADGVWVNWFTQETLVPRDDDGRVVLDAAQVFRNFPYALLVPAPPA